MMLFLSRPTIAGRLYLVGSLAILAVLALTAVSLYFAGGTRRAADALYEVGLVGAVGAGELELLLERHRRIVEAAPAGPDRLRTVRDTDEAARIEARMRELVVRTDPALLAEFGDAFPALWRQGAEVLRATGERTGEHAFDALGRYVMMAERLQDRIRRHRQDRIAGAHREAQALARSSSDHAAAVSLFAIVAAVLIGPFALLLMRGMILRLERVTAAMRRLAGDDTEVSVEDAGRPDEIGEMASAVAVFRENAVRLRDLNRWLDVALNNMARGLSVFDADGRLMVCNAAYVRMYALPDDLCRRGVSFDRILECRRALVEGIVGREGEGEAAVVPALEQLTRSPEPGELRQRLVDGRTVEISAKPLPWGGWVALHEDVTERFATAEKISRLARQDTLTGLANRHHFRESLERATAGLARGNDGFALLAIDLDRFKDVNDTLGHPAGDMLLHTLGARLAAMVRRGDVVARLGGDEFAIIQQGAAGRADAEALAGRVVEVLHQPFQIHGQRVEIGGTVGVALAPADGRAADELMKNADLALYRAKGERRGTYRFYDPAMEGRLRARRALEADLGRAVERGELELHYQPIVSLAERRVRACEALLRWHHQARGMIPPGEFIPLAEETGLISAIGAWALAEACRTAAGWEGDMRVAVNLSVAQFSGPDLVGLVRETLLATGLPAARLELEVTETLLLGDDPATLALLHRLRETGVAIALDDFGTGYSSLSHLRSFPFDKIKIDQTFVRDLPKRPNCQAIVDAVARLATNLGMATVAEGVEGEEHLERVRGAGCDCVQGYYFSRPVPAAELAEVVARIDARMEAGTTAPAG